MRGADGSFGFALDAKEVRGGAQPEHPVGHHGGRAMVTEETGLESEAGPVE